MPGQMLSGKHIKHQRSAEHDKDSLQRSRSLREEQREERREAQREEGREKPAETAGTINREDVKP